MKKHNPEMVISAKVLIPCYGCRFVNDPNSFANNSSVTYILHMGGKTAYVFGVPVAERREFLMYGIRFSKNQGTFLCVSVFGDPPFLNAHSRSLIVCGGAGYMEREGRGSSRFVMKEE